MPETPPAPRRELRVLETLGMSVAMMSPVLSMALFGGAPAVFVGRAAPLAYVFAGIGVILVAGGIIFLSRYFASAGSLYGLVGASVGPRAGFFTGWALLGPYLIWTASSSVLAGFFATRFCQDSGIWPEADYLPFALVCAVLILLLSTRDVRVLGRVLLSVEGLSVAVMIVVLVIIVSKLAGGFEGRTISHEVFELPQGATLQLLVLGSVFGFQAFAGFEGAASLGEETVNPRRNVPRAIAMAVGATVVLYLFTSSVMAMAFGTTDAQGKAFAESSGPLFDLSMTYVSPAAAMVLELGCVFSAFSAALGTMSGASRMIYALARDARPSSRFARLGNRGEPVTATLFVFVLALVLIIGVRLGGIDGLHVAFYFGSIGGLLLLVAYVMANAAAISKAIATGGRARVVAVTSALGIGMVLYLIYNTVYPAPKAPYNLFPYIAAAWLSIGLVIVLARPDIARRIGAGMTTNAAKQAAGDDATPDDTARHDHHGDDATVHQT